MSDTVSLTRKTHRRWGESLDFKLKPGAGMQGKMSEKQCFAFPGGEKTTNPFEHLAFLWLVKGFIPYRGCKGRLIGWKIYLLIQQMFTEQ